MTMIRCDDVVKDMVQPSETLVDIPVDDVTLEGMLSIPEGTPGIVVFAHGSGSSRHSPRNYVAEVIRDCGHGTLLLNLLIKEEDQIRANRFDIALLTDLLPLLSGCGSVRTPKT